MQVCEKYCPYHDEKWNVSSIRMYDGNDAIVLARVGTEPGVTCGCVVMYLKRKCDISEVRGREVEFAKRHVPYLMNDCPLDMEHKLYEFVKQGRRNGNKRHTAGKLDERATRGPH